jgi:hypothetical protein
MRNSIALFLVFCAGGCASSGRYVVDGKVLASIETAPEKVSRDADGTRTVGDAQVRVAWHPGDDTGRRPHYSGEVREGAHRTQYDDVAPSDDTVHPGGDEALDRVAAELVRREHLELEPLPAVRESDGRPVFLRTTTIRERAPLFDGSGRLKVTATAPNGLATGGLVLGVTGLTLTALGAGLDQQPTACTGGFQLFCGNGSGNQFAGQLLLGVGVVVAVGALALAVAALTRHPQEISGLRSLRAESTF